MQHNGAFGIFLIVCFCRGNSSSVSGFQNVTTYKNAADCQTFLEGEQCSKKSFWRVYMDAWQSLQDCHNCCRQMLLTSSPCCQYCSTHWTPILSYPQKKEGKFSWLVKLTQMTFSVSSDKYTRITTGQKWTRAGHTHICTRTYTVLNVAEPSKLTKPINSSETLSMCVWIRRHCCFLFAFPQGLNVFPQIFEHATFSRWRFFLWVSGWLRKLRPVFRSHSP